MKYISTDEIFMAEALKCAKRAYAAGEVPVGAVVTLDGKIVARGRNRREKAQNALYHAEIEAIGKACRKIGFWRLNDCDIYVTLEPCPMCAGAIINSRIRRVVFGAYDPKGGAVCSVIKMFESPFNHKPEVVGGVLAERCGYILSEFFSNLRKNK